VNRRSAPGARRVSRVVAGVVVLLGTAAWLGGCSALAGVTGELSSLGLINEDVAKAAEVGAAGAQVIGSINETFTPEQQYYVGRGVAATILAQYQPYRNAEATRYVNLLGQSLGLASSQPFLYMGYRFMILDSDEINAFATPGGHIFLTRGIIRLARSEDELAAIMAHEISHVVLQHGMKSIKSSRITSSVVDALATTATALTDNQLVELTASFSGSVNDVAQTLVTNGYSRATEREADAGAVQILLKTGYDPYGLVRVLERMGQELKPDGRDFAKTHPDPDVRIRWVEDMLEDVTVAPHADTAVTSQRFAAALRGI
jgi:predicted Zn-dependent protease